MPKNKPASPVINIENHGSLNIGGDLVGRDKISRTEVNGKKASIDEMLSLWEQQMIVVINSEKIPTSEQDDIKKQVSRIKEAISEDKNKNLSRIEKLINALAIMSSDIFDVAVTTLQNPLAGIGLVIRKISNKAIIEKNL